METDLVSWPGLVWRIELIAWNMGLRREVWDTTFASTGSVEKRKEAVLYPVDVRNCSTALRMWVFGTGTANIIFLKSPWVLCKTFHLPEDVRYYYEMSTM